MVAGYAVVLGPIFGFFLARFVDDETAWYPNYFLLAGSVGLLAAALVGVSWPLALILAGVGVYALASRRAWLLALVSGLLASLASSLVASQLLLVALIPASGFFVHHKRSYSLLWFLLVPIIITGFVFF